MRTDANSATLGAGVVLFPHVSTTSLILGVFLLVILVGAGLLWLVLAELDAANAVDEADLFGDPPPRDGDTWSRKAPAATPVAQDWPEDCAS
jgi:hypothetical protein